jgi:predicted alternative tryptophan synthase beta-subunit
MKEAEIKLVQEIINDLPKESESIRTFGQLIEYDIKNNCAIIIHKGIEFKINTELLVEFPGKLYATYNFIGEIYYDNSIPIMRARVYDEQENFNAELFEKILYERRKFLQNR